MDTKDYVRNWLDGERQYTLDKFGIDADNGHILEFATLGSEDGGYSVEEGWWDQQFSNYLHRAKVLGLDTPAGRQAAAKFTATAVGFLEAVVRQFGELPDPGVPSRENI